MRALLPKNERVRLFAISIDSPEKSRALIEKIESDGKGPVEFQLLSDPRSKTIDRYGLRDPAYAGQQIDGIPRPAVYVLDGEGIVRWVRIESDYRQRPGNDEIRAAIKNAG